MSTWSVGGLKSIKTVFVIYTTIHLLKTKIMTWLGCMTYNVTVKWTDLQEFENLSTSSLVSQRAWLGDVDWWGTGGTCLTHIFKERSWYINCPSPRIFICQKSYSVMNDTKQCGIVLPAPQSCPAKQCSSASSWHTDTCPSGGSTTEPLLVFQLLSTTKILHFFVHKF